MIKEFDCKECGRHVVYEQTGKGRNRKFCSKKCAIKFANHTYHVDYWKNRYANDPEWKAERNAKNAVYCRVRRNNLKDKAIKQFVTKLYNAETEQDIYDILVANFRIKKESYENADTVQLPEESN